MTISDMPTARKRGKRRRRIDETGPYKPLPGQMQFNWVGLGAGAESSGAPIDVTQRSVAVEAPELDGPLKPSVPCGHAITLSARPQTRNHGTAAGSPHPDPAAVETRDVARALRILHGPRPFEVRVLKIRGRGKPYNAAGYFVDPNAAAAVVAELDIARQPAGIYTVMNEIIPALTARSPNRLTDFLEDTATDRDILHRRWLLIDTDPDRPAGISSTAAELTEARLRTDAVFEWLRDQSWSEPLVAESGNGVHLLYPIDLPNDDESRRFVESVLKTLQARFGAAAEFSGRIPVKIDCAVFNAARITKLYGTWARKGCSTSDRPHRRSRLVYVPDYLEAAP